MSEINIEDSILVKLYNQYFENNGLGIRMSSLINRFSNGNPDEVEMILKELSSDLKITEINISYEITVLGMKYIQKEGLVDNSKQRQREEIIKILKEPCEKSQEMISGEIFVEKLNLSNQIKILPQMRYLADDGHVNLQPTMGAFTVRLTRAGQELAKALCS